MITMKSKLKVFLDISILNLIPVLKIETWRNFVSFQLIKKKSRTDKETDRCFYLIFGYVPFQSSPSLERRQSF